MATRRVSRAPTKLIQVHLRLFETDVRELQRRAREELVRWQVKLRKVVHEAVTRLDDDQETK